MNTNHAHVNPAVAHSHTRVDRRHCWLLMTFLAFVLALTVVPSTSAHAASREMKINQALSIARAQKGDPYVYGASGPNRFDCSGLIQFSYRRAHLRVPRTSAAQARAVTRIARRDLRRGDLVFFTSGGRVYHVGLFVGRKNGHVRVLHAPRPGQRVRIERVWTSNWFAGTFRRR